jgi:hypothetical protein
MLGASSRAAGVQSYSESPKKSSSFELMRDMIRVDARAWVLLKDAAAVRRIVPPRCAELNVTGWGRVRKGFEWARKGGREGGNAHRRAVRERSSSAQAISKCSRLVIICATWESVDVLVRLPP